MKKINWGWTLGINAAIALAGIVTWAITGHWWFV